MLIREGEARDADALASIYGHHVLHGVGTFEEVPPSVREMASRIDAVQARGLPYVVAEVDGAVQAFAYASPFRLRAAYRYTVENSVYVAADRRGKGLGKAVLRAVIEACELLDLRQMVALIGGGDNAASIGLHRACGFVPAGVLNAVGFKGGAWADVVIMQRPLSAGAGEPPATPSLGLIGG